MMSLVLIDTNVLLRTSRPTDPQCAVAISAQAILRSRGDSPCLVAQNIIEFRAVATRPDVVNGLGMSQADANAEILALKSLYPVYLDEPALLAEWERLVQAVGSVGKQNHDARLVAAMTIHRIETLLTFNKVDFTRYTHITVLTPDEVVAAAAGPET
ncbi:MAG TPA: hypothetical protein VKT77_09390 [Chthonomonadaceae bacterium]|nr:hypothetical protein [Chthonomonadaceae bacterium]